MDSRDGPPPPLSATNMMVGPNSYPNNSSASQMFPPPTSRFPFNSSASKPLDYDGSSSGGFNADSGKRRRGRPRKYSPDGNIALGLTPTPPPPISSSSGVVGHGDSGGTPSSEPTVKKHRGRPPGSGKKQMDALGAGGVGFTPHVILVKPGEDIASKITSFSQQGPRTVCILSANGAVSNVSLCQPAMSGGTITYEGRYEIISLTGSYLLSESNGNRSRTGGLSVSLAGSDGRVLGGGVAGMLVASSLVQVIVGSFIEDERKPIEHVIRSGTSSMPSQTISFGTPPVTAPSPSSQGASSDSSDGDGNDNRSLNMGPSGLYSNPGQALHNMNMYHHLWAGQTQ